MENKLFAKYGHVCELSDVRDELPMFRTRGNVCIEIKHQLQRSFMASDIDKRALKHLRSQKKIYGEHVRQTSYKYLYIHPYSVIRQWWELIMIFVFIVVFISIPLDLASFTLPLANNVGQQILWKISRMCFDLICCCDVVINFFTGYVDSKKQEVIMAPRKIAIRYCLTFFLPDLFSSLPNHVDLFFKIGRYTTIFTFLQYVSAMKLLRFFTFLKYCKHIGEAYNLNYARYRITLVLFCYILYFHILTCSNMIIIGVVESNFTAHSDPGLSSKKDLANFWRDDNETTDFFKTYFKILRASVYIGTFTCVRNTLTAHVPQIFLIIAWILSKFNYFFLIMQFMKLAKSARSSSRKYLEMVRELREYMMYKQLPVPLQRRLLSYYEFRFQKSYFRESEILNTISGQLKQDLILHSCRKLVEHVEFFKNLPTQLIIRIVSALIIEIYMVNDVILKAGSDGTCMYFIASGCVAIYTKSGHEVKHLEDGDYFGEYALLNRGLPRESSIVAVEISELYRLDYHHFVKVIMSYPDLLDKITKHATERQEMTQYLEERFTRGKVRIAKG